MAIEETWDDAFEADPGDNDFARLGPTEIRKHKRAIRSRLQIEHEFGTADSGTDTGYHKKLTLKNVSGGPSEAASGYTEISPDPDDNVIKYYPEGDALRSLIAADIQQTLTHKTHTYPVINPSSYSAQTCTISVASPSVITKATHGFTGGESIKFTTTGTLPTGISLNTYYFVLYIDSSTFNVSLTYGGTAVNVTGAGSGTHYYTQHPVVRATSDEINQLAGNTVGGTSAGDIVNIDDTQTLSNKTLASPTFTGTASGSIINASSYMTIPYIRLGKAASVSFNIRAITASGVNGGAAFAVAHGLTGYQAIRLVGGFFIYSGIYYYITPDTIGATYLFFPAAVLFGTGDVAVWVLYQSSTE